MMVMMMILPVFGYGYGTQSQQDPIVWHIFCMDPHLLPTAMEGGRRVFSWFVAKTCQLASVAHSCSNLKGSKSQDVEEEGF